MTTMHIRYNSKTEYNKASSEWSANLIAINMMRQDARINSIDLVSDETGEVLRTYTRG